MKDFEPKRGGGRIVEVIYKGSVMLVPWVRLENGSYCLYIC